MGKTEQEIGAALDWNWKEFLMDDSENISKITYHFWASARALLVDLYSYAQG
jgi:hypothetical protein